MPGCVGLASSWCFAGTDNRLAPVGITVGGYRDLSWDNGSGL